MTAQKTFLTSYPWLIPIAAISGLVLVILFALGFLGGGQKISQGTTEAIGQLVPTGAATLTVARQATTNVSAWQGTVRSRLAVKIAPKLNARIVDIPVHPGERVHKGAVLARLDDRELRAASQASQAAQAAAEAQAAQAAAEERRIIDLYAKQAATKQNYDAVLAGARAARALANQAASSAQQSQVLLGEDVLTAPFDGIIGERLQEPGDMGMPNQTIVTLLKPDDLRLEAAVPSTCAGQIGLGMAVTVRIDALHQTVQGKVDEIAPETDPQTRSQAIKISLPATHGLQHGQFAWLELACQAQQQVLLIPQTAVVSYGQLQAVKVVEGKQAHVRHIRTGKAYGGQVEVLSGLHEGETILLDSGLQS
ncbi:efflux RND transporter periplasmic adaptor subunit [Methylovulum psychrotolerans]|uniref:Efflux RND transporter periplasmic adaptor subunit n=1 Tax=Methylovulum psychrotolerans TaxID=1704499 RepID=A0A2S5CGS9_9GAMM|nr:efflux RND transporter periplasmic adaptor subunit [Methylovulum psychrotolerans]POZ50018.1 efflux RND transporter periplasmic adaptor subunit [Methylovulum psychrotolerans]